jgi:hypothetical protein
MNANTKNILIAIVVIIVLGLGYVAFVMPDQRSTSDKIGDAVHELPNGVDKAAGELKEDRTPGQKIGDAVRGAGDKIKENSGNSQ